LSSSPWRVQLWPEEEDGARLFIPGASRPTRTLRHVSRRQPIRLSQAHGLRSGQRALMSRPPRLRAGRSIHPQPPLFWPPTRLPLAQSHTPPGTTHPVQSGLRLRLRPQKLTFGRPLPSLRLRLQSGPIFHRQLHHHQPQLGVCGLSQPRHQHQPQVQLGVYGRSQPRHQHQPQVQLGVYGRSQPRHQHQHQAQLGVYGLSQPRHQHQLPRSPPQHQPLRQCTPLPSPLLRTRQQRLHQSRHSPAPPWLLTSPLQLCWVVLWLSSLSYKSNLLGLAKISPCSSSRWNQEMQYAALNHV